MFGVAILTTLLLASVIHVGFYKLALLAPSPVIAWKIAR